MLSQHKWNGFREKQEQSRLPARSVVNVYNVNWRHQAVRRYGRSDDWPHNHVFLRVQAAGERDISDDDVLLQISFLQRINKLYKLLCRATEWLFEVYVTYIHIIRQSVRRSGPQLPARPLPESETWVHRADLVPGDYHIAAHFRCIAAGNFIVIIIGKNGSGCGQQDGNAGAET